MGTSLVTGVVERTLYPIFRQVEFRGKRRLVRALPAAESGRRRARFRGGARLCLDLSQPLQRDFFAGVYDQAELRIVERLLRRGGDFVDVGAHVGMYTVTAAKTLAGRGRVLAFEPHPGSRAQLEENLALNGCRNATVVEAAASDRAGRRILAVPRAGDASWSTLEEGRLTESEPLQVTATTVDAEVERLGLRPTLVKLDVDGHEVAVVDGMLDTLRRHGPAVLCEIGPESTDAVDGLLAELGYSGRRVGLFGLHPLRTGSGYFNALFLPRGSG